MINLWTEEEIEYVKQNYKAMKVKDIALQLHRTIGAVTIKLRKMGLSKQKNILPVETLCWNCKNAGNGCIWFCEGKAVPGWYATQKSVHGKKSFAVYSCPAFSHIDIDILQNARDTGIYLDTPDKIKLLVEKSNMTIRELAEKTGISIQTMYSYTKKRCNICGDNILKIAYELGVTTDELLGMEEYILEKDEENG